VSLIRDPAVQDAKSIFEWIGIIGGVTTLTFGGILGYYKFAYKSAPEETQANGTITRNGTVQIAGDGSTARNAGVQIVGNSNTVVLSPEVHLAEHPKIKEQAANILAPVKQEGVDSLEFIYRRERSFYITHDEASVIVPALRGMRSDLHYEKPVEAIRLEGDTHEYRPVAIATVQVIKAVLEGAAAWEFKLNGKRVSARIFDVAFLRRVQDGEVAISGRTSLIVDLAVPLTGNIHAILKVHNIVPPPRQLDLLRSLEGGNGPE
jgi:hypothetical protein